MMTNEHFPNVEFPTVSLLITHFNRSNSLHHLLETLQALKMSFAEIIVSDDASNATHIARLLQLQNDFGFTLVSSSKNGGLGYNLNKGIHATSTPYVLYIQEDFIPLNNFPMAFEEALSIMELDQTVDLTGFSANDRYPYLKPYNKNYSLKTYRPWYWKTSKIYQYSDHPHLRRASFFTKFGNYKEGIKSDKTEYRMCVEFIKKGGKAIIYNDFKDLFRHENTILEPSTVQRSNWRQSDNPIISFVRTIYRQIKYNYDIHCTQK